MRVNEAFFGLALLALGVFVWLHAAGFPQVPGTAYGPAFFPQSLAAGLGIAAILLIWRGMRQIASGGRLSDFAPWVRQPGRWFGLLLMLSSMVIYAWLDDILGFHLTGFAITAMFMAYLGVKLWQALLYSILTVIAIWLLFARLLLVPLPGGPLTSYLW